MVLTITFQVTDLSIIGTVATVLSSMFGAVGCYIGYLTYKKNEVMIPS